MGALTESQIQNLIAAAREAQQAAHAPYSNFHVGAALLTEDGAVVTGCNVENASYGLTICAERNAIGRLVVERRKKPVVCVVVGPTAGPLTPCGACRQVLNEFNPDMSVICVGGDGSRATLKASELLPFSFGSKDLDAAAGR